MNKCSPLNFREALLNELFAHFIKYRFVNRCKSLKMKLCKHILLPPFGLERDFLIAGVVCSTPFFCAHLSVLQHLCNSATEGLCTDDLMLRC